MTGPTRRSLARSIGAATEQTTLAAMRLPARTLDYLFAVTRLSLGWVFLWPFLDKMFGLGHETPAAKAWINGGRAGTSRSGPGQASGDLPGQVEQ